MNIKPQTAVFQFSEAYPELSPLWESPGKVFDMRDIPGTVCYCDSAAEVEIARRIAAAGDPFLRWIDSGDFHYVSRLTAPRGRPYDLILLDHHPDMQEPAFGSVLSCGGWVRTLLREEPGLRRVLLLGVNPDLAEECSGFGDRVAVVPEGTPVPDALLSREVPVFLSLDKDVLDPAWARTDWDQGTMTLDELSAVVQRVFARNTVLGVDICGELTAAKGAREEDRRVNAATNAALQRLIGACLE